MDSDYLEKTFAPEPEDDDAIPAAAPMGRSGRATALMVVVGLLFVTQVLFGVFLLTRTTETDSRLASIEQAVDGIDARVDRLDSVAGSLGGRLDGLEASGASAAPIDGTSAGLPPIPDPGNTDTAVGLTVPAFTALDRTSGGELTVGPSDTSKIILVWAHWCPYCQQELPIMQDLLSSGDLDEFPSVEFVSLTTFIDPSRPNPLDEYLEEMRFGFPVLMDPDDSLATTLGVRAVPAWVVLDAQGTVLGRFTGAIPREQVLGVFAEVERLSGEG